MDMSSDEDDAAPLARKARRNDSDDEDEEPQALDPRDEFPLDGKYRNKEDRKWSVLAPFFAHLNLPG